MTNPTRDPAWWSHKLTGVQDGSMHCLRCKWSGWPDEVPATCKPLKITMQSLTVEDLRNSVLWLAEQVGEEGDTSLCGACGHGLRHHLNDRTLRSCTFPKGLGAPKALCRCLDYEPSTEP